jgi:Dolichyl-phosphate-mannose-protein mannosyltransferase
MASAESTPVRMLRNARSSLAAGRAAELVRSIPLALALVLAVGIALRLAVWLVYSPAVMSVPDTVPYVDMASSELFTDPVRPAGYSILLRGLHAVSSELSFTIAVQHLMGLMTAVLLYATVRRIGAPVWAGVVAAAAVALPLDQIVLEHALLTEAPFTLLLAVALYASVRVLDDPRRLAGPLTSRHAWLLAAGLALGISAWLRGVTAPMIPFLALWAALAIPGRWFERVGRAALAGGSAAAVLLVYFSLNAAQTDTFGLTQSPGWALYSRVAPFADCTRFDPPEGTSELCEQTPTAIRNGPDYYGWEAGSPAVRLFGGPPEGNDELAAFAREALKSQPVPYVATVVEDTARYLIPNYHVYPFGGPGYDSLDIGRRLPEIEADVSFWISDYYPGAQLDVDGGVSTVSELQDWLRVHPLLMLVAVAAGIGGIAVSRGRARAGLVLLLGAGLLLLVVPSATASYSARYAIPAEAPLVAAGAIGAWALLRRYRAGNARAPEAAEPAT